MAGQTAALLGTAMLREEMDAAMVPVHGALTAGEDIDGIPLQQNGDVAGLKETS